LSACGAKYKKKGKIYSARVKTGITDDAVSAAGSIGWLMRGM
jgi:hypothetical protein